MVAIQTQIPTIFSFSFSSQSNALLFLWRSSSISLMEAVHQIHPHSLAAAAGNDRRPEFQELPEPDIYIATSGELRIPVHSTILVLIRISFSFSFNLVLP